MSQLPYDICRCVSPTCHVRDTCARYLDRPTWESTPYANLEIQCHDAGVEQMFIQWEGNK